MKIQFSTKTFLKAFKIAASVTPKRDWRPILTHVKIIADEKDGAILHATDTEVGIRIRVDADVTKNGTALLPVNRFKKILESLKDGMATLESDGEMITITAAGASDQWTLPTQRHEDEFPDVDEFGADSYHSIPGESMQELIKKTVTSVRRTHPCMRLDGH
jgi:DNA polymerase-3 subunit beta